MRKKIFRQRFDGRGRTIHLDGNRTVSMAREDPPSQAALQRLNAVPGLERMNRCEGFEGVEETLLIKVGQSGNIVSCGGRKSLQAGGGKCVEDALNEHPPNLAERVPIEIKKRSRFVSGFEKINGFL